jgi:hypothetical protein
MASAAIINRLRFQRSTNTPATSPRSGYGSSAAKATAPAFAGECVTARTSSGYAIEADCVPAVESSCPAWSSMNSRFRRSGTGGMRGT